EDVLKDTGIVNVGSGDAIHNASYKMTSTCYIDGVKIYTLTNASDAEFKASTMKNGTLLFKTNEADAPFTYTDVAGDKKVTGLEIPVKKTSEGDAYILIADYSVTAGKDFVQKVMRVDDPADATIEVAEGVELCAKVWYTIPFEVPVYNSKSPSGYKYADGDYFFISKSVADIKGDKTFHPTSEDADGNDLWFEYSFLWNDTLENWNQAKSEMSLFGFRNAENKYRDFYYLYTKDGQSGDCPYKGHVDYSTYLGDLSYNCAIDLTSEGNGIGLYKAGWDSPISRASSPYLYDAENQTTGGWHRIGVRFHQEAEVDNDKGGVVYTGYTELFIDGVKVWKVQTDMQGYWKNSQWKELNGYGGDTTKKADLKWNDLLLWYAKTELAPEDNAEEWTLVDGLYYKDNDTMRVQARLDRVAQSTNAVYVAVDEVYWTCGDGFVRNVTPVVTPAAKTITLDYKGTYEDASDDLTASAAVFFQYAD
ncbi:MAG: hypothetical protein J6X72_01545, partial [Clostridia bacterium]|nr:hypothetical protein [Clostridia bacterium]